MLDVFSRCTNTLKIIFLLFYYKYYIEKSAILTMVSKYRYNIIIILSVLLKGTVSVISCDPLFKNVNDSKMAMPDLQRYLATLI